MSQVQISEQELERIFESAKGKGREGEGGLTPHTHSPSGACTAVTYGNPDQCRHLTKGECDFVDRELGARNAGFAKWRLGNCNI
ncbi:hypothetical protein DSM25559_3807 [Agrobacterium rosae]|uniref:Uncharacterized protein n=1 Tax=Agrobacterium rosae TaxID=1972867 RepID=A0A1R3U224_9HYPH|nr:hypothetical protein DSM25559_3807 [Agrobacterium rosae]